VLRFAGLRRRDLVLMSRFILVTSDNPVVALAPRSGNQMETLAPSGTARDLLFSSAAGACPNTTTRRKKGEP